MAQSGPRRSRPSQHPSVQQEIETTKPSSPSHGASTKSSGTIPIGASFYRLTMSPALITPHKLSPTINPDATSVPITVKWWVFGRISMLSENSLIALRYRAVS